jgi:hypothetical protein
MVGIGIGCNNTTLAMDCFQDRDLVGQGVVLDGLYLLNLDVLDLGIFAGIGVYDSRKVCRA